MKYSPEPGITVRLQGGLGNQLFIYATGYELSQKLDCPLYIDITWFRNHADRELGLNSFAHDAIYTSANPFVRRAENRIYRVVPRLLSKSSNVFVESKMEYEPEVSRLPIGSTLRGYYQSWKYFRESATKIREQIHGLLKPTEWYQTRCVEFQDQENWIAVHVRRGDYLNAGTRDVHGLTGFAYYRNAIERIDSQFDNQMPLKVFSDDHSAARMLFRGNGRKIEFVQEPLGSKPIESMLLMSLGSGIVAANSSFSWWAAWLGEKNTRPVIVPIPWFRTKQINQLDLFLRNWLPLDSGLY
ncbi:alpha-1,2-fucosyltransferase [Actinomycetota bacterium]|nr:alpha-1,2-fucosyltransferase [Actinomycetota bacterium]